MADERDRLRLEERELLDKIRETKGKLAKLRAEIQNIRKTRDELNETVKALKKDRDELRDAAKKNITTLRNLRKTTSRTFEGVRAEHEMSQLEWKVQTAPMSKDEEKRLMAKIRSLESKVVSHKNVQRLSQNVDSNRKEADEIHARIQEVAQSSQKHHEEVIRLGSKFTELRQKLEDQQTKLDEVRGRVREVSQKYFSMVTMSRESDKASRREKEKAHKETLKQLAKKKLSQGEKLSLQELSALYEDEGENEKG